ncbi:MAG TPA: RagB/SusD family nutrient uptake outer membrane protein [Chryseolinea sp.]|nr:RagB/SusD family nutrient uptake outer membrane protein [Chryseolinea sp.]
MQNLNKIKYRGWFPIVALVLAWACSDSFLDQKPLGVLDQGALSNKFGANASLISAYSMLDGYNIDNANVWAANPVNWVFGSISTDDAYKGSEATDDPGGFAQTEIYQWTPSMINLNDKYVATFEGINRANATIKLAAAATDLTDAERAQILAEAKFLRAWFHFELYKVFTHIAYYRETDTDLKKPNAGVDVLAECIADVSEIVNVLPAVQAQKGRVRKSAAQAFLGKLYMYQAQPASGTVLDASKLTLAKAQFELVLPAHSLVSCYHDMYASATENNTESIFAVQSNGYDNNQGRNANWLNQLAHPQGGITSCCGFHQPSQNLVNAYRVDAAGLPLNDNTFNDNPTSAQPVDPRLDFNVGRDGVPYYDWGTHAASWIRSRAYAGQYSPKKYMPFKTDPAVGGGWNANAINTINIQLIRLSDVMLMLAECEVEIGSLSKAEQLVNQIRTRAANCVQGPAGATGAASIITNLSDPTITWATYKVAPYPPGTFSTKDIAREKVRLERRLELALEGHRFFDLKRYGLDYAASVINGYIAVEKTRRSYLVDAAPFAARHMSFPLPTTQVQLSIVNGTPTLTQNEGY